ncbi:Na(+)/H(+) antiporter subunit C [Mycolicibacterium thermoresistibile]|jgi:multicomponent Na+:H+ antiporter subunit C|uniref:Multisubunit Na+/H+ antiporter, MnhC subunit n=2 Tax=Mycolicibacterium thermoresistibile TaxID=1797 RepID=A0A117IMS5_MYCTH|nr:Na(+)/H(+) antiporter subunit C [Mycolicibacterium thermoresistibile]EHI12356.1 putative monovalent cation/H+ antiporter subunit C [Mycolicibacterium thermoresistibile ATCC 19527]MCV7190935.1 Na(+)/H(+) antiporter subunit C [Mycolicibacterium thermoresistibile]GAT15726.1 multisubunit Na+/H+ antiporter, MnhC subunit [Mycolicibacterium thermoresistibile]SNW16727.1 multisubunit Na+/H+ antiporter, MnhC subunit [Mycolicibacterium thermoresistibile]
MTSFLTQLILIGGLTSAGVYLLLERSLIRMLLGILLISNAVNLLIITASGPSGNPPVRDHISNSSENNADPLAQAMILTAIVITMGVAAFVLALAYRSYRLTTVEEVSDDPEDTRVSRLTGEEAAALDRDKPRFDPKRDTDEPDELDALPGAEGSR